MLHAAAHLHVSIRHDIYELSTWRRKPGLQVVKPSLYPHAFMFIIMHRGTHHTNRGSKRQVSAHTDYVVVAGLHSY